MVDQAHKARPAFRSLVSAAGCSYLCGSVPGLYIEDLGKYLLPLYLGGSCAIIALDSGPPGSWFTGYTVLPAESARDEFASGSGWVLLSGKALEKLLVMRELVPWAQVYMFCKKPEVFVPPPTDYWTCGVEEGADAGLLQYMDSSGASLYLADGAVDGGEVWLTGCYFLFRKDVALVGEIIRRLFSEKYGESEEDLYKRVVGPKNRG